VDGNIERVMARLFGVSAPLPAAKSELRRLAASLVPAARPGDFAQAMMDLGAVICTPRRPSCLLCPWRGACAAYREGDPEKFPRRAAKRGGNLRHGMAFVVVRSDGAVLLRRRPKRGLLAGMLEVPSSEWIGGPPAAPDRHAAAKVVPLVGLAWRVLPGVVRHVFTHFPLELNVLAAKAPVGTRAPKGMRFVPRRALADEALPSLMRKVIAHAVEKVRVPGRKVA
jgi:A/G-specific adenine glycosylase